MSNSVPWITYHGVQLHHVSANGAYCYTTSHVGIDADGAPNAYGPSNTGLDFNANAGYPDGSWESVLVPDPHDRDKPYQQPDGPFRGFFVTQTSLKDNISPDTSPAKYVDASKIPYIVFPGDFYRLRGTGHMGDLAMVRNLSNGKTSAAIVADQGPSSAPLGEISIKLASNLGGTNPNPRNGSGAPTGQIQYVLFPGSRQRPAWPLTATQIDDLAAAALQEIGGWSAIPDH